jgi:hypothetical protein
MGTHYKTQQEKFDYRINKQNSVECCLIIEIKEKRAKDWESGLTFKELKKSIEKRRKRNFSDIRIYDAISLINRYGKHHGVYLRSEYGFVIDNDNNRHPQWRYFIPTNHDDINREYGDLENKKMIIGLKEDHLQHHEQITIPQEKQLEELRI